MSNESASAVAGLKQGRDGAFNHVRLIGKGPRLRSDFAGCLCVLMSG